MNDFTADFNGLSAPENEFVRSIFMLMRGIPRTIEHRFIEQDVLAIGTNRRTIATFPPDAVSIARPTVINVTILTRSGQRTGAIEPLGRTFKHELFPSRHEMFFFLEDCLLSTHAGPEVEPDPRSVSIAGTRTIGLSLSYEARIQAVRANQTAKIEMLRVRIKLVQSVEPVRNTT